MGMLHRFHGTNLSKAVAELWDEARWAETGFCRFFLGDDTSTVSWWDRNHFLGVFAFKDVLYMFEPYFSSKARHEYGISTRCFCFLNVLWSRCTVNIYNIYIYIHIFIDIYICIFFCILYTPNMDNKHPQVLLTICPKQSDIRWLFGRFFVIGWPPFSSNTGRTLSWFKASKLSQKQLQHELWKTTSVD